MSESARDSDDRGQSRLRRRLGDESGQTTFFVLCSFITFFLFFALVANVGQAVNRRVMLQMVADAGAFSGASAQATAMNTISEFNQYLETTWDITEVLMLYFTIHYCGVDDAIVMIYDIIEMALSTLIRVTNHAGSVWAIMEAEKVTQANIADLFPGDQVHTPLQSFGGLLTSPQSLASGVAHIANMREAWPALFDGPLELVRIEQEETSKNWVCVSFPPPRIQSKNHDFNLHWEKETDDEITRFYWWVEAEPVDALVLPGVFPQIPKMTAVALAKPVGGDINPDKEGAEYVAKMMPLSVIDYTLPDFSGSLPTLAEVLH